MKKIYIFLTLLLTSLFSIPSLASMEEIAVIDYRTVFLSTDMARETFEDLRESKEFKKLAEEGQIKQQELISISEELKKDGKTMSDEDKADKGKAAQTLYQDIQYTNQKLQALEAEILKKLEIDQTPNVQKVVNELVKAKKISLLFNSGALLAFDVNNPAINVTPEVIDLVNKANKANEGK
ncbi:OmpH family outer membrane protein [SAR86 cluster bacterium]|jgi:Skp family chaperone for outer membrane proteins|nr:OmpH family outer membrane protein [SAR86 cluster bacterium]